MEESFKLLQEINWFLEPVSDLILFLFTSGTGITFLIIGFFVYLIASLANALWVRKLAHLGAKSTYERGNVPLIENIYLLLSGFGTYFRANNC